VAEAQESSQRGAARALVIAWSVGAGLLLFLAPSVPGVWDGVAGVPMFGAALSGSLARWGVSAFGFVLLLMGAADLAAALAARWSR
jgi:hypothetical protein